MKRTSRKSKSTGRIKRAIKAKEPKVHENAKSMLCLKGNKCNEAMDMLLHDLASLRKPLVRMFSRRNPVHPFEDASSLEFFSEKNDTSLFAMVSNTKKRPNNLVLGRTFDHKILDMVEISVDAFTPISECPGPAKAIGSKPCFLFQGDGFEHNPTLVNLKNLLLDMFRGHVLDTVPLPTLDHIISVTAVDDKVYFRVFSLLFRKSGTKIPKVELSPHGPNINMSLRRTHFAERDLAREARRQPKQAKAKKVKNVTTDALGTKSGKIHMERQNYDELQLRKVKALKVVRKKARSEGSVASDADDVDSDDDSESVGAGAGAGAGAGSSAGGGGSKKRDAVSAAPAHSSRKSRRLRE